jgi:hypothetical protein
MRWDGCAPCGAVLGSVALSPRSLIESGDRLAHWAAVRRGSDRWQCRGTLVGEEKIFEYSSTTLSTCFCCVERSTVETMDVAVIFHLF